MCYYIWLSLPQSFPKCHSSHYSDFMQMQLTVAGIVLYRPLFGIQLPECTNVRSSSSRNCHNYSEWHNFPVYGILRISDEAFAVYFIFIYCTLKINLLRCATFSFAFFLDYCVLWYDPKRQLYNRRCVACLQQFMF